MGLTLVTAATGYPVSTDEARFHCRVDGAVEDDFLDALIAAATDYVEQYTGRAIMAQTWKLSLDAFADEILLPRGPVSTVSFVKYYDTSDVEQTASAALYTVDLASDPQRIVRKPDASWPAAADGINKVNITFVSGYASVPAAIRQAILLLIGDWYRGRENTVLGSNQPTEAPHAVTALLANYRAFF